MAMLRIRILVVEDDADERSNWKRELDALNVDLEAQQIEINHTFAASKDEADVLLADRVFDCAVVDLRLKAKQGAAPNADGNDVVAMLLERELAVVAIFSGEAGLAIETSRSKGRVKTFTKGAGEAEGTSRVLQWIREQIPLIRALQSASSQIQREMVRLFVHSIWPRWASWHGHATGRTPLGSAIARHMASHVNAALAASETAGAHPEEWYFIPPLADAIQTGDILEKDGSFYIVVTPRCDLARRQDVRFVICARCSAIGAEWTQRVQAVRDAQKALEENTGTGGEVKSRETLGKKQEHLRKLVEHDRSLKKHFLPELRRPDAGSVGPMFVDLGDIVRFETASDVEYTGLLKCRIASLAPEFLPGLVQRYGAHTGRFGIPDYSTEFM